MPNDKASLFYQAEMLYQQMASVGFDWPSPLDVLKKIEEESEEVAELLHLDRNDKALKEEYGDLLLVTLHLAAHLNVCPKSALSEAIAKCSTRFEQLQQLAIDKNVSIEQLSLSELESLWGEVKRLEAR